MTSCPVTGELYCKCLNDKINLQSDLRSTLRKLFTDHAVYTVFVIKSIVGGQKDVPALLPRLLENQKEIGDQLAPLIGKAKGEKLTQVLTEHIKLAGEVIKAAVTKSPKLKKIIEQLFSNSDDVAKVLTSINPSKLPYDMTQPMFRDHNQSVIDMTLARIANHFEDEITLYDNYFNDMMIMSDMIHDAI